MNGKATRIQWVKVSGGARAWPAWMAGDRVWGDFGDGTVTSAGATSARVAWDLFPAANHDAVDGRRLQAA